MVITSSGFATASCGPSTMAISEASRICSSTACEIASNGDVACDAWSAHQANPKQAMQFMAATRGAREARMIRIGLLGAGRIGQIHGRNVAAHAQAKLVGVAD